MSTQRNNSSIIGDLGELKNLPVSLLRIAFDIFCTVDGVQVVLTSLWCFLHWGMERFKWAASLF